MQKVILFFFLCLFLNPNFSAGQNQRFNHLTINDGLTQSEVYCFLEDQQGFMWFGTVDGLNKYDGYGIKTFYTEKGNPNTLPNTTIRALAEDKMGRIWIGTENGLCFYNPENESIQQVQFKKTIVNFQINALLVDKSILLIAAKNGLYKINLNTTNNDWSNKTLTPILLSGDSLKLQTIFKNNNGSYWLLKGNAIVKVSFDEKMMRLEEIETINFEENFSFKDIAIDFLGNLWISTYNNGLIRYDMSKKQTSLFKHSPKETSISSNKCSSIVFDKNNNLWIGTRDKGLCLVKKNNLNKEEPFFNTIKFSPKNPNGLSSNLIFKLYTSRNNIIWVGTVGSGVNSYNPEQKEFNYSSTKSSNSIPSTNNHFIRSLFKDSKEMLWIGKQNNGLFVENNNSTKKIGFDTQNVFHISQFKDRFYLIGSSSGVNLISYNKGKINSLETDHVGACFDVVKKNDSIIYAASMKGVFSFDISSKTLKNKKLVLETENTRALLYDKKQEKLYVATQGNGLTVLDTKNKNKPKTFTTSNSSISNNYIRSIKKDKNNNIWLGTYEGLNRITNINSNISFETFTKKNGLPNNMIQSITEDLSGYLWLASNKGLSKMDVMSGSFTNYTKEDGLQSNEFSENTNMIDKNGKIYLGGNNGITFFQPKNIVSSTAKSNAKITDFYLGNTATLPVERNTAGKITKKSILLAKNIQLKPNQNNFSFQFSSMLQYKPGKSKYSYMLEGYDTEWYHTNANNRKAIYTNIPFGNYTFKVKSTNSDGVWQEKATALDIHIETPFVYSYTAYFIYFLLLLGIIILIISYYLNREKAVLAEKTNVQLKEINTIRTQFFMNASHDIRTPLTLIEGPINGLLKHFSFSPDIQKQLKLIQRNTKKLKHLTDQLLDIRKAETSKLNVALKTMDFISFVREEVSHFEYQTKTKGIQLVFNPIEEEYPLSFDANKVSKLIFNLIGNAIKNTDTGTITVQVSFSEKKDNTNYVKVSIIDTGIGIETKEVKKLFNRFYQNNSSEVVGYGIGLSHCKELLTILGGFIEINSKVGAGTNVSFYIPKHKANKSDIPEEKHQVELAKSIGVLKIKTKDTDKKPNILVIEDNNEMRFYIKYELEKYYTVHEATDGDDGIVKALNILPDIIITDNMMPNKTGLEVCAELKNNIKTSHIPIIMLTASVEDMVEYKSLELGANDFLSKPFDMSLLLLKTDSILKNRANLKAFFKNKLSLAPKDLEIESIDDIFISKLMQCIEKGIPDSEFNVVSMEEKMGMSHANFYRKVKSLTGMSGIEILNDMRLKRAYQLLESTENIRISEVTYLTGFTNPKYFSKCFKEKYNIAPSKVKKI